MNSEKFLDLYIELELLGKNSYGLKEENGGIIAQMQKMPIFKVYSNELNYIRELRNFFTHKEKLGGSFPIEPVSQLIEFTEKIISFIKNPPKAIEYCIRIDQVCSAKKDDLVHPYMVKMKENTYTHIPILDDKVVIGVFSENTLFGVLLEEEMIYDINKVTFRDATIFKHCQLDNHVSEVFKFINRNAYLEDINYFFI